MSKDIEIVPLSKDTIQEGLFLLQKVFHTFMGEEDPYYWFKVSLEPEKNKKVMLKRGVSEVRYFIVKDKTNNKIIGTTGLYHLTKDPKDTVWLGFYCLDSEYRGRGLGKEVLQWTIEKAKKEGNTTLCLYTTPNGDLAVAQVIYDKFGFITTKTEEKDGETIIYKELKL